MGLGLLAIWTVGLFLALFIIMELQERL